MEDLFFTVPKGVVPDIFEPTYHLLCLLVEPEAGRECRQTIESKKPSEN